jgi:uncharacterized phage infection (PIP) family protein YhgE
MSDTSFDGDGRERFGNTAAESKSAMKRVSDLAGDLKTQATGLAQDAARQVKDQAGQLAEGAKNAASGAGDKLWNTAEDKKNAGADFVSGLAGAVRRAAGAFDDQIPQAGDYIRQAAEQIDGASDALRQRNVSELVEGVQDFARRQPTAFLGMTVLAGFAAVRFLRSSTSASARPDRREGSIPSSAPQSENARRLAGVATNMAQEQRM